MDEVSLFPSDSVVVGFSLIVGFVSRTRTEQLLQEKQAGTFLLRFSETSEEVAISFSWVDGGGNGTCLQCRHETPSLYGT